MSLNIQQIFAANPITTLASADLLYVGVSPFAATDDAAIAYSALAAFGNFLSITEVITTSANLVANTIVLANNAGLVTLTLPATCAVGKRFLIRGVGAGGWKVAQNASQIIHLGSSATTTGVGGSIASTNQYDALELTCIVADTEFVCSGVQGIITVV
jgi:hypothetical protein